MPRSSTTHRARRPSRAVASLLVAALAASSPSARAQEPLPRAPLVADEPPELALPPGPVVDEARDLVRAGRYAAAAVRLEAALAATNDARLLYHAGVARSLAGHHALSLRHFVAAQARLEGTSETVRQQLRARLATEQALTIPVRLKLARGRGGPTIPADRLTGARITVRAATEPPDSRAMWILAAGELEQLRLDPGPWIVQVQLRGYRPAELLRNAIPGADDTWEVAVVPEQVPVELRFYPSRALRRAHLRLTALGEPGRLIERDIDRSPLTMMLSSGTWQLDVTARRRQAHLQFDVAPGQRPIDVPLARQRRRQGVGEPFERDDRLAAAVGIVLVAELAVTVGLTIAGGVISTRALNRNERLLMSALVDDATGDADGTPGLAQVETSFPTAEFHGDLKRGLNLQSGGLGVLGGAFGMLASQLAVQARLKRRFAFIEMGVGAAALAGGAVWMASYLDRRDRELAAVDPTDRLTGPDLRELTGHNFGASMLTGLGIGLLVFPVVSLLTDRALKRRRSASLSPRFGPGRAGLSLAGRF